MARNPTTRSRNRLKDLGYTVETVEKWNAHAKVYNDLYGFIDILAIREGETLAVQTTSASNVSSRVRKIEEHENLPVVLAAGWKVVVHGWAKERNRWILKKEVQIRRAVEQKAGYKNEGR